MRNKGKSRDFIYEYEGQSVVYTIVDEISRTCITKEAKEYGETGNFKLLGADKTYISGTSL